MRHVSRVANIDPYRNIIIACDFNLVFTYVLAGWEGPTFDSKILYTTIRWEKKKQHPLGMIQT